MFSYKYPLKVVSYLEKLNFKLYRSNTFTDNNIVGYLDIDIDFADKGKDPRRIILNSKYSVEEQRWAIAYLIAKYKLEFSESSRIRSYHSEYRIGDNEYFNFAFRIVAPDNAYNRTYKKFYRKTKSLVDTIVELHKYFGIPARIIKEKIVE